LIDLHCHILPALDDGAIDIEDSVAMAREAQEDGVEVVCATPHIHPDHRVRVAELGRRVAAVNEVLERESVRVRVAQGGEIAEAMIDELQDAVLREVSLDRNGVWVLLEPRPGPLGDETLRAVERLAARGFRSIIAHPERHPSADFQAQLEALVAAGALIQATAALVAEGPASPTLLTLAGHGLVHLLGSDAHSSHGGRSMRLSPGLERLAGVEPLKQHLNWIARDGPAAVLRGEPVTPPFAPC
jgi:protein-tyrosine phosphatase